MWVGLQIHPVEFDWTGGLRFTLLPGTVIPRECVGANLVLIFSPFWVTFTFTFSSVLLNIAGMDESWTGRE